MHFFEILNILYTHGGLKLRCPVFLCILIALSGLLFLLLSKVVFCFVLKWWLLTQLYMRINHKMPSGLPESNPQSSTENCHIYSYWIPRWFCCTLLIENLSTIYTLYKHFSQLSTVLWVETLTNYWKKRFHWTDKPRQSVSKYILSVGFYEFPFQKWTKFNKLKAFF